MKAFTLALPFALALAVPAEARRVDPPRPSPCDYFIPTGEPLPRQDQSQQSTFLFDIPNPSYRDRRSGSVAKGEPVTVIQECGSKLKVRTVRGEEGWINTVALPNELRLSNQAAKRPITTDKDCEQRILEPSLIAQCKAGLLAGREREREVATASYLTGDEVRKLVAGKTLVFLPRHRDPRMAPEPVTAFFASDGEFFMATGAAGNPTLVRARWVVENDILCMPGAYQPCARLRKASDRLVWVSDKGPEFVFTLSEGDSAGTVERVSKFYPNAKPPPAPSGMESFLPSLR